MPISLTKFSFKLDLKEELADVPRGKHKKVKQDIGKMLLREIEKDTRRQKSPVDGDSYPALDPKYRAIKKRLGKGTKANLHLNNKMISSIKSRNVENGVQLEITKRKIIPQAFNHNTGDTIPQRQVLPDEELHEEFRPAIMKKVERIAARSRDVRATRELKLRRLSRADLEEKLLDAIGRRNAQRILREGINMEEIVEEILSGD